MSATTLYTHASGLETTSNNTSDLVVSNFVELAVDITITGNQGSNPTIQFFIDRKDSNNIYNSIWQSVSQTSSSAQISTSIGAGLAYNQSLGATIRFRWIIGGTSTPGYVFSASLQAK